MKFTTALIVLAMSGTAAQANSIQRFAADSASFPSLVRVGTPAAPKPEPVKAEADTGLPAMPQLGADGKEMDGRSQLEAWAEAHGTTVEDVLAKRLYGHYPKNTDGEIAALAPRKKAEPAKDVSTDEQKTASVTPDEAAPEAPAAIKAGAGGQPMFPQGELRKPE